MDKLYLPPRDRYFGCRRCYNLTYHSAQTHDGRVSRLRRNPALLAALLGNLEGDPAIDADTTKRLRQTLTEKLALDPDSVREALFGPDASNS